MRRPARQRVVGTVFVSVVVAATTVALVMSISAVEWPAMDKPSPTADATAAASPEGLARGRSLYLRFGCARCHGRVGQGGLSNPNYTGGTIPSLNMMAERLGLFDPEEAEQVIDLLLSGADLPALRSDPPFRTFARFLAQLENVRAVIRNGSTAGKVDPEGLEPRHMPSWGSRLSPRQVDLLVAYFISLYPWEED